MSFMLIKWVEDPPSYNVLPTKEVLKGDIKFGSLVQVRYKNGLAVAEIINVGMCI